MYYENEIKQKNLVFLPDGSGKIYRTGTMLLLITSDDTADMLTWKLRDLILSHPDFNQSLTQNNLTRSLNWIYENIIDKSKPVVSELLCGSFDHIASILSKQITPGYSYTSVGVFLKTCYELYINELLDFFNTFIAIAAETSGIATVEQKQLLAEFSKRAETMYSTYTRELYKQGEDVDVPLVEAHIITTFDELLIYEYCRIRKENVTVRFCSNCGKPYFPQKSYSIYCPDPAPQNPDKTCREIGPQIRRQEKRKSDPNEHEHHNTTCRLYNEIRRMKEYGIEEDEASEKSFRAQLRRENERYKEAKDINKE